MLTSDEGAYVYEDKDVLVTISEKLDGAHPKDKNPEIARSSGVLLAEFHQAVSTLDHESQGWLNKGRALADSEKLSEANPLTPVIRQILHDNLKIFDVGLPAGIIHGDVYIDNLLFHGNTATAILDFGESERNLFLVDIVRTICSSVGIKDGRIDPELMKSLIEGYESIRPLTDQEKEYIPMTIRYVCAAASVWFQLHAMPQREEFFVGIAQQSFEE
jgi:homoserine kinase type II